MGFVENRAGDARTANVAFFFFLHAASRIVVESWNTNTILLHLFFPL